MLQKIHDKISGWVAYFLIGLLGVVFVFWGIDFGFNSVRYAVKVKAESRPWWHTAEKVGIEQVREAWQNQLNQFQQFYRGEIPEEIRAGLQARLLQDFARRELLTQYTHDMGYRVSDQEILQSYESIPAFQVDGKFNRDAAQFQLRNMGYTPAMFEAEQRKFLQISQLEQAIAQSAFVTPAELERELRFQKEQREVSWLVLPAAKFAGAVKPDDAAIQKYYEENKDRYMTPESVALSYVELKVSDLAAEVKVTDEALASFYESATDRFTDDEGNVKPLAQVRAEVEAEYRTQEAEKRFSEKQELLADRAFESLNDLEPVARELGLAVQEVPEFRKDMGGGALLGRQEVIEAAFSEPVLNGENSRPIELEPGHVVVVRASAHRAAEPRPLESVREAIVDSIKEEESRKQARDLAQRSAALMQSGNEDLSRLAAEFKAQPEGPRFVSRNDMEVPVEVRNALFGTAAPPEGQAVFRSVALGNGDAAVLKFSGVRIDATPETEEERAARVARGRQQLANAEFAAYVAQLERDSTVVRNTKAFE